MSTNHEELLENYVLGNCDQVILSKLMPGSDQSELYNCLHILNYSENLSKEDHIRVKKYISAPTAQNRKIDLRYTLRKYEEANSELEKIEIIGELKNKLNIQLEEYPPSDLKKGEIVGGKKKTASNVLSNRILDIPAELELLYTGAKSISDFNIPEILGIFNFNKLNERDLLSLCECQKIAGVDDPEFIKRIIFLAKKDISEYKYLRQHQIFNNLSIIQMDIISKEFRGILEEASFTGIYLQKKFAQELDPKLQERISLSEKQLNLHKIYNYIISLPKQFEGLKSEILLELLENGVKMGKYIIIYYCILVYIYIYIYIYI